LPAINLSLDSIVPDLVVFFWMVNIDTVLDESFSQVELLDGSSGVVLG
jgi:hypothetical protein